MLEKTYCKNYNADMAIEEEKRPNLLIANSPFEEKSNKPESIAYWDGHTPFDIHTQADYPGGIIIIDSGRDCIDYPKGTMQKVNEIIEEYTSNRPLPDSIREINKPGECLITFDLPTYSLIAFTSESWNPYQQQYKKDSYIAVVVQLEDKYHAWKALDINSEDASHEVMSCRALEIGKVEHVRRGQDDNPQWSLERNLEVKLLQFGDLKKRELTRLVPSRRPENPNPSLLGRFFRRK